MQDLISRQAAIEKISETIWDTAVANDVKTILKELPSAQPEQRWIPCSERLPDDDRTKVVTLANGNVEAGYYSNGDWWCIGDTISLENPIVIAWMPLPEPYKEGEHETDRR